MNGLFSAPELCAHWPLPMTMISLPIFGAPDAKMADRAVASPHAVRRQSARSRQRRANNAKKIADIGRRRVQNIESRCGSELRVLAPSFECLVLRRIDLQGQ
jgi:hypothetical protein